MKILIITTRLNLGGIGIYVSSLARGLKRKGHEVIVASSGGQLQGVLNADGIKHIYIPIDTSSEVGPHIMLAVMKLLGVVRKENIQIIHAQTRVSQVIAYYVEKFSKVTFVTTCHGFFKRRLIRRLLPCWGQRVVSISDAVKEHLVDTMKVPEEKIELIYNGIDTSLLNEKPSKEKKEKTRKDFNITGNPIIGITARLSDVKGHTYLLRAMPAMKEKFPNMQLLIVGSGNKRYEKKLHLLCEKLNITGDVVFQPSIYNVYDALSIMDVFVLPSVQEGLGLSLLEALAAGLPVVASGVGGICSIIRNEENGLLVQPKDDKALAGAVIRLLEEKEYAKTLGEKGKQFVLAEFTLDKMVERMGGFYKRALGAK